MLPIWSGTVPSRTAWPLGWEPRPWRPRPSTGGSARWSPAGRSIPGTPPSVWTASRWSPARAMPSRSPSAAIRADRCGRWCNWAPTHGPPTASLPVRPCRRSRPDRSGSSHRKPGRTSRSSSRSAAPGIVTGSYASTMWRWSAVLPWNPIGPTPGHGSGSTSWATCPTGRSGPPSSPTPKGRWTGRCAMPRAPLWPPVGRSRAVSTTAPGWRCMWPTSRILRRSATASPWVPMAKPATRSPSGPISTIPCGSMRSPTTIRCALASPSTGQSPVTPMPDRPGMSRRPAVRIPTRATTACPASRRKSAYRSMANPGLATTRWMSSVAGTTLATTASMSSTAAFPWPR